MNLLNVKDLKFSYEQNAPEPEFQFDLICQAGEIIAITGHSGVGKSTFLNLVSGFLMPHQGSIIIDGCDVTSFSPAKRSISTLFQKYNVFEHLSVIENICLGVSPRSRPDKKQVVLANTMLGNVGLAGFDKRTIRDLSGGQMQRVALARELLRDTKLMLLDEPFNALDDETRQIILPLITAAASNNRAIILVTHDLHDVQEIISRHMILRNGRLENS